MEGQRKKPAIAFSLLALGLFYFQPLVFGGDGVDKQFTVVAPYGPTPITITKKWGFPRTIVSSAMITNNCEFLINCKSIKLITVGNLAYVSADFREKRDKNTEVTGRFAVELAKEEAASSVDPGTAGGAMDSDADLTQGVLAYPQKLCQSLTTTGSCWSKEKCDGKKLSNGPQTCTQCWNNTVSRSFKSESSGSCYGPFDRASREESSSDRL